MKIVRAAIRPFALPLLRPIATAHGTLEARTGFLVSVEDEAGRVAHGEATPFAAFGTEDLGRCEGALRRGLSAWLAQGENETRSDEKRSLSRSDEFGRWGAGGSVRARETPCARAALEAAWCDLAAQREGQSLARWIRTESHLSGEAGGKIASEVAVQALVQGTSPEEVVASARAATTEGFRAFKLKLAVEAEANAFGLDLERVAALRDAVGPSARLRLDANEAWTRHEAESAFAQLAQFRVDYVEQPVGRKALADLAALDGESGVKVAADEALLGDGLATCLEARAASVLIVKPAALGGVFEALSLVERARAKGMRIVWSNLFEGVVGRAAALALAAATGEADEVHGLGTAGLLASDLDEAAAVPDAAERGGMLATVSVLARARAVEPAWSASSARSASPVWSNEIWEAEK